MPPQTRSRASGVVKKIKYNDSLDLSDADSASDYSREGRKKLSRRKGSEDESYFTESDKGTVSESVSHSESSVDSSDKVEEIEGGEDVDDQKRLTLRPKNRGSNRQFRPSRDIPAVIKLTSVNSSLLTLDEVEIKGRILEEMTPSLRATVSYLGMKLATLSEGLSDDAKKALELETINITLSCFVRSRVPPVSAFFDCSCVGISREIASKYFSNLQAVVRELLREKRNRTECELNAVDPLVLQYDPKWINNITFSARDIFIES